MEHTETKENKETYYNQVKLKYVDLYCKIVEQYPHYYERIISKHYQNDYKFHDLLEDDYFLYDIMTLNQELIYYDFVTLNGLKSNPHEKLVFCYKYFIEGWNSKKILDKLRKKTLNKIFINFINEYSRQSGLPQVVVLCYFYPLEEELYKTTKELTKLNRYFTKIDITGFLKTGKKEKKIYIKNIIDKRVNSIDKWCNRIREKIIGDTVELFNKLNWL